VTGVYAPGELPDRTRLLSRIEDSGARIIALIAPPGYGRTNLAERASERDDSRISRDFRVELQGLGEVLVNLERDVPSDPHVRATIVLDNVDALEREGDDLSLLACFIANAPAHTRFVLCSTTEPAFLGQLLPHEVLVFGSEDLQLNVEECAAVFAGLNGAAEAAAAIQTLTRGWPVAVLMLLRYAREHDVQHALTRTSDLIEALTSYLVANVFALLDPGGLDDLLRVTAIPYVRTTDLQTDAMRLPFVRGGTDGLDLHPLVRAVIVRRYASRCAVILADAAERAKRGGDWERAAACAIDAGDSAGAAAALDAMGALVLETPSKIYRAIFRRIDPLYLTAYPNLWASTVPMRRFVTSPATLLFEAKTIWAGVSDQTPPLLHAAIEGIRFIFKRKIVLGAISLALFAVLFGGATALLPVYAASILHVGPTGFGILRSAPALGAALVAAFIARHPLKRRAGRVLFYCVAGFGVATIVFGISKNFWLSVIALALTGGFDMVSVIIRVALVQLGTPDAMRGRVNAVENVFIGASNELGAFESGTLAAFIGTEASVVAGGVATLVVIALWTVLFPKLRTFDRLDPSQQAPARKPG